MPKKKAKHKKFFRPVHLQAFLVLTFYLIASKFIFIKFVSGKYLTEYFFGPYIFGVISTFIFLYLFSHEDFFHFMKDVEKKEKGKESKYLHKYKNHGKVVTAIIIGIIGGPIFLALTLRFLLQEFGYKYLVVFVSMLISTIFSVSIAKGFLILFI